MPDPFEQLRTLPSHPPVPAPPMEDVRRAAAVRKRRRRRVAGGVALAALFTAGVAVYAATGPGEGDNGTVVAASPPDRDPRWTVDRASATPVAPQEHSGTLAGHVLLVPSGYAEPGDVVAYSASDGGELWRYHAGDTAFVQGVGDDVAIVSPSTGAVAAIGLTDGRERWILTIAPAEWPDGATVTADTVYFGTSARFVGATEPPVVYAVDLVTGAVRWRTELESGSVLQWSAPAVHDGKVLVLAVPAAQDGSAPTGNVVALDAESGSVAWTADLGTASTGLHAQPVVVVDGTVVAPTADRGVAAFDEATGRALWQRGDGLAAIAMSDEHVGLRLGDQVAAVDAGTGEPTWSVDVAAVDDAPVWIGVTGTVVVVTAAKGMIGIDSATGAERWTAEVDDLTGPPVLAGGRVYFSTPTTLFAVEIESGAIQWQAAGDYAGGPLANAVAVVVGTDQGTLLGYEP